ncbi:hypothetical protein LCGC14_0488800 [marine sediment metagenome]|uniref:Uncharacterized protein n=1 Tax=marine sediment metagenome TaxID=412755 RepID=A0A0F9VG10_9ZZZZ
MTKQEEIMVEVNHILSKNTFCFGATGKALGFNTLNATREVLAHLHSQGVVIVVDRELPDDSDYDQYVTKEWTEELHKAGFLNAVEPLI